jgi:hypothetical protein
MPAIPSDVRTYQARSRLYTGVRGPWLEHLVEDEGLTYEEAMEALVGWEHIPFIDEKNGHMATVLKRNREVHIAIYRRFRHRNAVSARRIKEFLQPMLEKNIFLVTKVGKDESARFIEHLGFQELGSTMDGTVRTYILNEIKLPGKKHEHI